MPDIQEIFLAQQNYKFRLRKTDAKSRVATLNTLKKTIRTYENEIYEALKQDLRKSSFEAAITEVLFIYGELDHALKNLSGWMKPRRAGKALSNFFAKNRIYYEPKGVSLIIAPWNYPFQLVMSPLISAIAAGNCVMVKPSELSPATSLVIAKIIEKAFKPEEIACIQGDAEMSTALLALPFDHIFFTGSTDIGKIVMAAAAKNLTSVTLELGGKSPAIVDTTADLKDAAEKIAWGKLINAGQTCIAPDYVLIAAGKEAEFIQFYQEAARKMFFVNGELNAEVYAKIINRKHFERLQQLKADAVANGAQLAWDTPDETGEIMGPAVITGVNRNNRIMQEEIFGPLLPVVPFNGVDEAIAYVNYGNKPLAMYVFSSSNANISHFLQQTSAGGTCVNDVLVHISNPKLPFGGVNSSGNGNCHGEFGFRAFSHERAVVFQSKLGMTSMIYPPYENKNWVLKLLKKTM